MRHEKLIFILIILILLSVKVLKAQEEGLTTIPFAFSLIDPPGENGPWADKDVMFHVTLLSGQVGAVSGLQIGGITNHVLHDFTGFDGSEVYSQVDGNFSGMQVSGILTVTKGNFVGMQTTGIYGYVGGDYFGIQNAGIVNKVNGQFSGLQAAGLINESKNINGVQISGITNGSRKVRGLQVAGIMNESADVVGAQVAGIMNDADDVKGAQIGAFYNKAGIVKGAQIGVVNKSLKLDGIAIGLVNISTAGHVYMVGWAGSDMEYNGGFKFAPNDWWITELTLGYNPSIDSLEYEYSLGSYVGIHMDAFGPLWFELDVGQHNEITGHLLDFEDYDEKYRMRLELRAKLGMDFGKRVGLFAGVTQHRMLEPDEEFYFWEFGHSATSLIAGVQLTVSELIEGIH